MPEVFLKIYQSVQEDDYKKAEELQRIANALIMLCVQGHNYVGAIKRALSWMGIPAGDTRSPFINYTSEQEEQLKKDFREIKNRYSISDIDFLEYL